MNSIDAILALNVLRFVLGLSIETAGAQRRDGGRAVSGEAREERWMGFVPGRGHHQQLLAGPRQALDDGEAGFGLHGHIDEAVLAEVAGQGLTETAH